MSSDVVIRVEHIAKQYRLGTVGTGTLSHDVNRWWHRVRGKPDPYLKVTESNDRAHRSDAEYVWALNDINFEVRQGEILGVIGRNGAGKSTLLKILSRVTAPTTGEIKVKGRIGSLLEVGTGFHPELTGRENVFLNGAILGMTKSEIRSKLDEIVEFSGCERYLDTPVKRYSSGMMVRLGFAVAAHLETDILLIDEVLAVGDMEFQRRCQNKMRDVTGQGRTILFVSHNLAAIENICSRCLILSNSELAFDGNTPEAVAEYLQQRRVPALSLDEAAGRKGRGGLRVSSISFEDAHGHPLSVASSGGDLSIRLHYELSPDVHLGEVVAAIRVENTHGVSVFQHYSTLSGQTFTSLPERGVFVFQVPRLPLPPADYSLSYAILGDRETLDSVTDAITLNVRPGKFFKTFELPPSRSSVVLVDGDWRVEPEAS